MKIKGQVVKCLSVILCLCFPFGEATIISGTTFYIMSSLLARQIMLSFYDMALTALDRRYAQRPYVNIPFSPELKSEPTEPLTLDTFSPILKYIWPELLEKPNNSTNVTISSNSTRKFDARYDNSDSKSQEATSQEVQDYLIQDKDIEDLAHEELLKENPNFFYYVLKDKMEKTKKEEEKRKTMRASVANQANAQMKVTKKQKLTIKSPFNLRRQVPRKRRPGYFKLPLFIRKPRPYGRIYYNNPRIPVTRVDRPLLHFHY